MTARKSKQGRFLCPALNLSLKVNGDSKEYPFEQLAYHRYDFIKILLDFVAHFRYLPVIGFGFAIMSKTIITKNSRN